MANRQELIRKNEWQEMKQRFKDFGYNSAIHLNIGDGIEKLVALGYLIPILETGTGLITPDGIKASKDKFFNHPFGRDTYITLLGILSAMTDFGADSENSRIYNLRLIENAAKSFLKYMKDDGELAHEVRKINPNNQDDRNFLNEFKDNIRVHPETGEYMLFTSVDATGFGLEALDRILDADPENKEFENDVLPKMKLMTKWAIKNVHEYKGLIGYKGSKDHEHTWQDGAKSILNAHGDVPERPVYPVLEQGLYWSALSRMADRFMTTDPELSKQAREAAQAIQENFNEYFLLETESIPSIARTLTGTGAEATNLKVLEKIEYENIDALNALGFMYAGKTILNKKNEKKLPDIVNRLVYALKAGSQYGLRTQTTESPVAEGLGYQGPDSIWPCANGMAVKTLDSLGAIMEEKGNTDAEQQFRNHALDIAEGTARVLAYFGTPVEMCRLNKDGTLQQYTEMRPDGTFFMNQKIQAWTVSWGYWLYYYLKDNKTQNIYIKKGVESEVSQEVRARPPQQTEHSFGKT